MYNLNKKLAPIKNQGVTIPIDIPIVNNHAELMSGFKVCKKTILLYTFFNEHGEFMFESDAMMVERELLVQETLRKIQLTSLSSMVSIDEDLVNATKRARIMTPPADASLLETRVSAGQPASSSVAAPAVQAPVVPKPALAKAGAKSE